MGCPRSEPPFVGESILNCDEDEIGQALVSAMTAPICHSWGMLVGMMNWWLTSPFRCRFDLTVTITGEVILGAVNGGQGIFFSFASK